MTMNIKSKWDRLKWTVIQAVVASLAAVPLIGLGALESAGYAGLTALFAGLSLIARRELGEA